MYIKCSVKAMHTWLADFHPVLFCKTALCGNSLLCFKAQDCNAIHLWTEYYFWGGVSVVVIVVVVQIVKLLGGENLAPSRVCFAYRPWSPDTPEFNYIV